MFKAIKEGIVLGLTIVGTTIGAGFASGRELWEFFSSYGLQSYLGIIIAMILFALSSIYIVWISRKHATDNYYEVLLVLIGKPLARVFDGFIFLYLFSGSVIMFAGSGATFAQWDLPYIYGVLGLAIAVWLVLLGDINGLMKINSLLIPILVGVLLLITFNYAANNSSFTGEYLNSHLKVWPSAITYAALNVISLLGVLSTMGKKITSTSGMILGGVFAAVILGIVAIMINSSLLKVSYVQQYEIPLFSLIPANEQLLKVLTTIILWFAIYTTVLSNTHGLVHRIQKRLKYSSGVLSIFVIVSMLPLTFIGFSTLVNILYPLYGVLNLYILSVIILYPFQTTS